MATIESELKETQYVSPITYDFTALLAINQNGQATINLDDLAQDVEIDISGITNLFEGGLYIDIIGSDTYTCSFSAATLAEFALIQDLTVPTINGGSGVRNSLVLSWNRAIPTSSTKLSERIIGIVSRGNVYNLPVVPTITSATVENDSPSDLIVDLDKNSDITDLTGLSLNFTVGTPKTLVSVAGTGTSQFTFTLSTPIEPTDEFSFVYGATNTIFTAGTSDRLVAGSTVVNNNVSAGVLLDPPTFTDRYFIDIIDTYNLFSTSGNATTYADETLNKTAGSYVEFDVVDATESNPVFVGLYGLGEITQFASYNHYMQISAAEAYRAVALSIGQLFTDATVMDGYTLRMQLEDDGSGGYNVLYRRSSDGVNFTTVATTPLQIAGSIYVHVNIVTAERYARNIRIFNV